jgi:hypothetical protein
VLDVRVSLDTSRVAVQRSHVEIEIALRRGGGGGGGPVEALYHLVTLVHLD